MKDKLKIIAKELLGSPHKLKIVKFFHENPASVDTSSSIAIWCGLKEYDISDIEQHLDELVGLGVLVAHRTSSMAGYGYTHNREIIKRIGQILSGETKQDG